METIAENMWFTVDYGHEVVTKYENFVSVNIPLNHPATEMHDTMYINEKDMMLYNLGEDSSTSGKVFKVVGYLTLIAVALAILFFVYRAIRKNGFNPKSSSAINEHKVDPIF